jgi:hypothetical protein
MVEKLRTSLQRSEIGAIQKRHEGILLLRTVQGYNREEHFEEALFLVVFVKYLTTTLPEAWPRTVGLFQSVTRHWWPVMAVAAWIGHRRPVYTT